MTKQLLGSLLLMAATAGMYGMEGDQPDLSSDEWLTTITNIGKSSSAKDPAFFSNFKKDVKTYGAFFYKSNNHFWGICFLKGSRDEEFWDLPTDIAKKSYEYLINRTKSQ